VEAKPGTEIILTDFIGAAEGPDLDRPHPQSTLIFFWSQNVH